MPPRRGVRVDPSLFINYAEYVPDEDATERPHVGPSTSLRRGHAAYSTHLPRTRQQFVCANYAFGVAPDSVISLEDPDFPVDWRNVDVVFESSVPEDCPICLHPLRAPRITRCGHIFDHICALQHLHHSAASSRYGNEAKCPLCSDRMSAVDLRKVFFRRRRPLGDVVELQLVARPRQSVVARPFCPSDGAAMFASLPSGMKTDDMFFSRLVVADTRFLLKLVSDTMSELNAVLAEDMSLESFVEAAKRVIVAERDVLLRRQREDEVEAYSDAASGGTFSARNRPSGRTRDWAAVSGRQSYHSSDGTSPGSASDHSADRYCDSAGKESRSDMAMHVFYQAKDGQNVFLHPLCHRILTSAYSSDYAGAPKSVEGSVREIQRHTMDETLRHRYRFLGHLPLGCEFVFVEIDLTGIVPEGTLDHFKNEISQREQGRKRRALASERENRRIEEQKSEKLRQYFQLANSQRMPIQAKESVDSNDYSSFPPISPTDVEPAGPLQGRESDQGPSSFPPHQNYEGSCSGGLWGADVSSYSAATRHMGVFPELSASVGSRTRAATGSPAAGGVDLGAGSRPVAIPVLSVAAGEGSGRSSESASAWADASSRGDIRVVPPHGPCGPPLPNPPPVLAEVRTSDASLHPPEPLSETRVPQTSRRSRRHGGRSTITLLSNAGLTPSYRK